MTKKKALTVRYMTLLLGIYIMTLGASLAMQAGIGMSSTEAFILTGADLTGLTIGRFTIIYNLLFVLGQIVILRKEFKPLQFLQFPMSFVFGIFLDFNMDHVWSHLWNYGYAGCIISVIAGMAITAVGVNFVLGSNVVMTPIDAFYYVLGQKTGISTGKARMVLDGVLLVANTAIILTITHNWTIREGTVICLILGPFIDLFHKPITKILERFQDDKIQEHER